ncbi:MAG: hypothetical protein EHM93_15835 [Bacteroidales bacterium]|nr:MAG: hypothetical protein EHM93_15835 [Bacteroidales bacterium]
MKSIKFIILLIIPIFCTCCSHKTKKFYREDQLKDFIKIDLEIQSPKNSIFIFLTGVTSGCHPCEDALLNQVDSICKFERLINYSKYIIFTEKNYRTLTYPLQKNVNIIVQKEYQLQKHGVDMPYHLIIEFDKKGNIKYWNWLHSKTIDEIFLSLK